MRRALAALAALFAVAGCQKPPPQSVEVRDAWVRLPAVPGRPAAAYFTLAGGPTAERLIAVKSPRVGRVELHEGGMHDGMMTMRPLDGADVAAGGEAKFEPGGNHAMLFRVDPSVQPGRDLPLAFRFASGKAIQVDAKVLAAGDPSPE